MPDFNIVSRGFEEDPPENDVIGNYSGMRICVGYLGAEPQFLDSKELSPENVIAACKWLNLNPDELSTANAAQAVLKWIMADRPVKKDDEDISLSEFF